MDIHTSSHARKDIVSQGGTATSTDVEVSLDLKTKLHFAHGKYEAVLERAEQDDDAQETFTSGAANMVRASSMLTDCIARAVSSNH
jgi:hypothetical protein